jgi:ketosteroid isomerase-like protein
MAASDPLAVHRLFAERFNARDIQGVLALYEPTATLVPEPGSTVSGIAAIREALSGFLALNAPIKLEPRLLAQTDEIALLGSPWTLSAKAADGSPIELGGTTADVVRRQRDGSWLVVIDNPWGTA